MVYPREAGVQPARFSDVFDAKSAALATRVLQSPIEVPTSPPTFSREIRWLEQKFGLLTSMPTTVQATLAINPAELASLAEGVLAQLQATGQLVQATNKSGQQAELFGLPKLLPEQAEVFSGVLGVADDLGATHEQLLSSAHKDGRKTTESLLFMHNLVFWLYEKVLVMLTQLLAEQDKLKKTDVELQLSNLHSIVEHNHQVVSPQVRERLTVISQDIRSLEAYLIYLSHLGDELKRAATIPEYALGLKLARPTVLGGVQ